MEKTYEELQKELYDKLQNGENHNLSEIAMPGVVNKLHTEKEKKEKK